MAFNPHKNFAYGRILTAPSPATSGTSLTVESGQGALFPSTFPFNVTIWKAGEQATAANAEVATVTNRAGDVFTITRAQESSTARTVIVGDQIANTISNKVFTDIEDAISAAITQLTSEVTAGPGGGSVAATINKAITPTWTGIHTFDAASIIVGKITNANNLFQFVKPATNGHNTFDFDSTDPGVNFFRKYTDSPFQIELASSGGIDLVIDSNNNETGTTFRVLANAIRGGSQTALLTVTDLGAGAGLMTVNGRITGLSAATAASDAVTKSYVDGLVVGLIDDRGNYDASVNTFPASGGSGAAGAVLKGDLWFISVAGTLGGVAAAIGDSVRALVDTPGQTAANWSIIEANIGFVPANELTTITPNAPLTGGGSLAANRTISIPQATGSVSGYLLAADWTTFNAKQPAGNYITALTTDVVASGPGSVVATIQAGVVTLAKMANIATLTVIGRSTAAPGVPEAITAASDFQVLRRSGAALAFGSINLASANAVTGLLGVANGGTNAGAFTDGSIVFAGASGTYTQDNARLFWNRTTFKMGIGTNVPNEQLEITGSFRIPTTSSTVGIIKQGSSRLLHTYGTNNLFVGLTAGNFTTSGYNNMAFGTNALTSIGTGYTNIAVGDQALNFCSDGYGNTAIGQSALYYCTSGFFNNAFGSASLLFLTSGSANNAMGQAALYAITTGSYNTGVGPSAGRSIVAGVYNSFIGAEAGYTDGVNATTDVSYSIAIGAKAQVQQNNCIVLGGTAGAFQCRVAISRPTATAWLHLPAGTNLAGGAPIKLDPNVSGLLTVPEVGAMEFVNNGVADGLYLTLTGPIRHSVAWQDNPLSVEVFV